MRLAAHLPVEFGRISPHLAQEEGRASHSEGLHRLTHTSIHTSIGEQFDSKNRKAIVLLATHCLLWGGSLTHSLTHSDASEPVDVLARVMSPKKDPQTEEYTQLDITPGSFVCWGKGKYLEADTSLCCRKAGCLCRTCLVLPSGSAAVRPNKKRNANEMHFCNGPADSAAATSTGRKSSSEACDCTVFVSEERWRAHQGKGGWRRGDQTRPFV